MSLDTGKTGSANVLGAGNGGTTAPAAILCVDDDPNILEGLRRHLRKRFRVHTALGPDEGLSAIANRGPFSVVVSDFLMPGMDGIQFLNRVRSLCPDTVRIMLTGQADFSTAMAAVNQGNIFRFLVKPCTHLVLEKVLEAGIDQHKLLIAEKQLTEGTLLGCVQVLIEVLSIVQPDTFSRATRLRRYVRQMADTLRLSNTWQIEASAMLSQIGWITLSPEILAKAAAGQQMSEEERPRFVAHASAAARILEKVPRLERVARIIEKQHVSFKDLPGPPKLGHADLSVIGSQMLRAAIDFDNLRQRGMQHSDALRQMHKEEGFYMPEILDAMASIEHTEAMDEIRRMPLSALAAGMILEDELVGKNGTLILARGQEITATLLQRLPIHYGLPKDHPCRVRVRRSAV